MTITELTAEELELVAGGGEMLTPPLARSGEMQNGRSGEMQNG